MNTRIYTHVYDNKLNGIGKPTHIYTHIYNKLNGIGKPTHIYTHMYMTIN